MPLPGPFDEAKHPRGYAGRFASGPGNGSNVHALKGRGRPGPTPAKRAHAVTPIRTASTRMRAVGTLHPQFVGD